MNQFTYLNENQTKAVDKLAKAGRGICWWRIGEGKTRIALAWASLLCSDNNSKALVVCSPNAVRQWMDEANLCGFSRLEFLSYGVLQTSQADSVIYHMLKDTTIKCAIIDELWLFKNVKALRSQKVHKISAALPTLGLSGSLVTARNIEDLFGQAYAVSIERNLCSSLTKFRTQFCVSAPSFGGGLRYWAAAGALETIQKRLAPFVDIYFPPPERAAKLIPITVNPTEQQQEHLTRVKEEYFTTLDSGDLEIKNAAVLISKIQQISDGAVIDSCGNVASVQSSKLSRTIELLDQLSDAGERPIVWVAFKASLDLLASRLGKKATTLSSHTEFDFKGWKQKKYNFCIATIGSGASLNDFTETQYAIVYSAPYNHRAVQQAFGRTNRKGSPHQVAYYYLMQTDQTVDESVYRNLKLTSDIERSIISTSAQVIQQYMNKLTQVK